MFQAQKPLGAMLFAISLLAACGPQSAYNGSPYGDFSQADDDRASSPNTAWPGSTSQVSPSLLNLITLLSQPASATNASPWRWRIEDQALVRVFSHNDLPRDPSVRFWWIVQQPSMLYPTWTSPTQQFVAQRLVGPSESSGPDANANSGGNRFQPQFASLVHQYNFFQSDPGHNPISVEISRTEDAAVLAVYYQGTGVARAAWLSSGHGLQFEAGKSWGPLSGTFRFTAADAAATHGSSQPAFGQQQRRAALYVTTLQGKHVLEDLAQVPAVQQAMLRVDPFTTTQNLFGGELIDAVDGALHERSGYLPLNPREHYQLQITGNTDDPTGSIEPLPAVY